ncbi:TPA: DUF3987 domain-containing protein [Salmonella enterica]|nr:DUF3987 domain-containing protein [Salmonella enterica]
MLPNELTALNQWVVWREEQNPDPSKKPRKIPYRPHDTAKRASSKDPFTWSSYALAVQVALDPSNNFTGIGFVLHEDDPYCCIDLDDSGLTPERWALHLDIVKRFNSYTERSHSKQGVHIWVKADNQAGNKDSSNGIEIYTQERFIVMTGDVISDLSTDESISTHIQDAPFLVSQLRASFFTEKARELSEIDIKTTKTDQEIWELANRNPLFSQLFFGTYDKERLGKSEADLAFCNCLSWFMQDRDKIFWAWKQSALYRDYAERTMLDYTISESFNNVIEKIDNTVLMEKMRKEIEFKNAQSEIHETEVEPMKEIDETLPMPQGLMQEITRFIYEAAPLPVYEIALAGAMSLMAGICGRSYSISGTGLNLYTVLLAETGRGKDAAASGITTLLSAVPIPNATKYILPSSIASAPALQKHLAKQPSGVSMLEEFGLLLQKWTSKKANPNTEDFRRLILQLYSASSHGKFLSENIHSDSDKNSNRVERPAFSFFGDSTPSTFYTALDEGLVGEGLLSRFTVIQYRGKRVYDNPNRIVEPSPMLVSKLTDLLSYVMRLEANNQVCYVGMTEEASQMSKAYSRRVTQLINESNDSTVEMWNRANLMALRLAALHAVSINYLNPIIDKVSLDWGIAIVENSVASFKRELDSGNVGDINSDIRQINDAKRKIKEYYTKPYEACAKGYKVRKDLWEAKIITYSYLHNSLTKLASFKKDNLKATDVLNKVITALISSGDIKLLSEQDMSKHNFTGKGYILVNTALLQ